MLNREINVDFSKWNWKRIKLFLKRIAQVAFFSLVITASVMVIEEYLFFYYDFDGDYYADSEDYGSCNVTGLEIVGDITIYGGEDEYVYTSSDEIMYAILEAENDKSVKAVFIEVDSYGGSPVAGEEIASALKNLSKPSVVVIRGAGVSAAYLAVSGADAIFASKNSDVFGMGVTMSYLDYSESNKTEGVNYISLSSSEFKDSADPNKGLSSKEREVLMRDVNIMHNNLVELIAENRGLEFDYVNNLADGSTMLGQMALEYGLVDYIGDVFVAQDYLEGVLDEEIDVCW